MDGGPAGVEGCAGSGPVGLEVRIGVQGATTSLAMTRVKHHSRSWVRVVARGNGVRRRRWDVVIGAGVGSASGDWCQDCMDMTETFWSCLDPLGLRPFSFSLDSIFELTPFL